MMTPIILFCIIIFTFLWWNWEALIKLKRCIQFSYTLPGPTLGEFLKNAKSERALIWFKELHQRYGTIFSIWLGKDLFVLLSDPNDVKIVLSSNQLLHKSSTYEILKSWLGNGLLINGGQEWQSRRKMLTPAFHFKILSAFKQPMMDNCKILLNKLESVADGEQIVNIYNYITLFTLDVICETAMGIKKNAQMDEDSEYVKAVQKICSIMQKDSFSFWRRISYFFKWRADVKERNKTLNILHTETKRVVENRRKLLEEDDIQNINMEEINMGVKRRLAFLDVLLIAQKQGVPLTDLQIREEVDTFMFEGHDTTSSALSFAIYLLSQHPQVQQKVYNEINSLEEGETESMKYLEAVIKETLRIFPSVPMFSRQVMNDIQLRDITIPKGASVSVVVYLLHRNPKEFPNPEQFIPERFLEKNENMHPYCFVPFSAGPRNCIGQRFAMLELKCTLANLLRHFEFLPVDEFKMVLLAELIMKSKGGVSVKIRKRGTTETT